MNKSECPAAFYQKARSKYVDQVAKDKKALGNYKQKLKEYVNNISDNDAISYLALLYLLKKKPEFLTKCQEQMVMQVTSLEDDKGKTTNVIITKPLDEDDNVIPMKKSTTESKPKTLPYEKPKRQSRGSDAEDVSFIRLMNEVNRLI